MRCSYNWNMFSKKLAPSAQALLFYELTRTHLAGHQFMDFVWKIGSTNPEFRTEGLLHLSFDPEAELKHLQKQEDSGPRIQAFWEYVSERSDYFSEFSGKRPIHPLEMYGCMDDYFSANGRYVPAGLESVPDAMMNVCVRNVLGSLNLNSRKEKQNQDSRTRAALSVGFSQPRSRVIGTFSPRRAAVPYDVTEFIRFMTENQCVLVDGQYGIPMVQSFIRTNKSGKFHNFTDRFGLRIIEGVMSEIIQKNLEYSELVKHFMTVLVTQAIPFGSTIRDTDFHRQMTDSELKLWYNLGVVFAERIFRLMQFFRTTGIKLPE